jgi:hypothetical protein
MLVPGPADAGLIENNFVVAAAMTKQQASNHKQIPSTKHH